MPFGQSCMCLDPMLIVFSFLIKNSDFFSYTLEYEKYWSYYRIKVDKNIFAFSHHEYPLKLYISMPLSATIPLFLFKEIHF